MSTHLSVETAMGTTILANSSSVPIRINNHVYLVKQASKLKPGDMVIYEKEFVRKTLSEIEPYLMETPRYKHAKNILFDQDSQGSWLPRFRTYLWKGLDPSANDEKIRKEGRADFSDEEYANAIDTIHQCLAKRDISLHHETIRAWLKGRVIAPHNKEIFRYLIPINPMFEEIARSFEPDGPALNYYDVYVRVNQGVMRYLGEKKGEQKKDQGNQKETEHISLGREIQGVLKYVVDEIDEQYSVTRVIDIKPLPREKKGNGNQDEDLEIRLSQGIYQGQTSPTKTVEFRNLAQLFDDKANIELAFFSCIMDYLSTITVENMPEYQFALKDIGYACLYFVTDSKYYSERILGNDEEFNQIEPICQELAKDLREGLIENSLGLSLGTLQETADVLRNINNSLPPLAHQYIREYDRASSRFTPTATQGLAGFLSGDLVTAAYDMARAKGTSDVKKEVIRAHHLKQKLKREYGISGPVLFGSEKRFAEMTNFMRNLGTNALDTAKQYKNLCDELQMNTFNAYGISAMLGYLQPPVTFAHKIENSTLDQIMSLQTGFLANPGVTKMST